MELFYIFAALLIAVLVSVLTKRRVVIETVSLIATSVALVGAVLIALQVSSNGTYVLNQYFSVGGLSSIVMLIVAFLGFITVMYSIPYLRQESTDHIIGDTRAREYFILTNLFILAMFLADTANNPIFAWISIEATTLSTAFLISFYNKPSAMEAAWKYLIINSTGLLLGFFGTLLYFTSIGSLSGNEAVTWNLLLQNATSMDPVIAKVAFIFVLIGYGVKIGFVPMHTWKPDVYSKTPAPVGALLSSALLSVGFVILLKFKEITDRAVDPAFTSELLMTFGLLSIAIPAFFMFVAKNYKRLLAYSSIEHAGIIALGFGLGGIGAFAATLHLIYHACVKSALFLLAGNILLRYHSSKIENVRGMITVMPKTSALFFVGFLAVIGIPPFGIFLTKIYILSAGIYAHPVITGFAILFITMLAVGFFRNVSLMMFGEKPAPIKKEKENIWLLIPPYIGLTTFLFLSLYFPSFMFVLINSSSFI